MAICFRDFIISIEPNQLLQRLLNHDIDTVTCVSAEDDKINTDIAEDCSRLFLDDLGKSSPGDEDVNEVELDIGGNNDKLELVTGIGQWIFGGKIQTAKMNF